LTDNLKNYSTYLVVKSPIIVQVKKIYIPQPNAGEGD